MNFNNIWHDYCFYCSFKQINAVFVSLSILKVFKNLIDLNFLIVVYTFYLNKLSNILYIRNQYTFSNWSTMFRSSWSDIASTKLQEKLCKAFLDVCLINVATIDKHSLLNLKYCWLFWQKLLKPCCLWQDKLSGECSLWLLLSIVVGILQRWLQYHYLEHLWCKSSYSFIL